MMVAFIMSQVGQMMSLVSGEPHHENTGRRGWLGRSLFSGQSPRFTIISRSGIWTWDGIIEGWNKISYSWKFSLDKTFIEPSYPCITEIYRLCIIINTGQKILPDKNFAHESRVKINFSPGKNFSAIHVYCGMQLYNYAVYHVASSPGPFPDFSMLPPSFSVCNIEILVHSSMECAWGWG